MSCSDSFIGSIDAARVCRPVCEMRPAERTASIAVCSARSLPEHSITASTPTPSVRVLEQRGDVDLRRVEHLADVEAAGERRRGSG